MEFLIPEYGRGSDTWIDVPALNVMAQALRYLSLSVEHSIVVTYHSIKVRVPSLEVFALSKLLVISKRKDVAKARKDIATAQSLGEFLLQKTEYRRRFAMIFASFPVGWRKSI